MSDKKKKSKKKTGLGIAIWILLFLIILIVFLVKQEEIKENFEKSGASALIEKKLGKDVFDNKKEDSKNDETVVIDVNKKITKTEPAQKPEQTKKSETVAKKEEPQKKTVQPVKSEEKKPENKVEPVKKEEVAPKKEQQTVKSEPKTEPKSEQKSETKQNSAQTKTEQKIEPKSEKVAKVEEKKSAPVVENTIKKKICFISIDSEGPIVRKEVTRSVSKDSPMGDALNMLLSGPSGTEQKTGCQTLIPQGSRLLGASVKNGVATLNFSEEFQFNQFGAEGSLAQLMQVVYTATEFSTVKSVQILIEGKKRDYLTEGVWVGSPLSRSSF